jgi:DNA invertase Pin-like site-specific DNA recombinase
VPEHCPCDREAALYARVSSKVQEKKGTIASQIEALRNHATAHDLEIEEDYVCTDEGYSGALLARPELDRHAGASGSDAHAG